MLVGFATMGDRARARKGMERGKERLVPIVLRRRNGIGIKGESRLGYWPLPQSIMIDQ